LSAAKFAALTPQLRWHQLNSDLASKVSNSHFGPERGCVVSTNRSTLAQNQAVSCIHALRLVFDTAGLLQNENCCPKAYAALPRVVSVIEGFEESSNRSTAARLVFHSHRVRGKAALKPPALQTLRECSGRGKRASASGVRAALAPLSPGRIGDRRSGSWAG